MIPFPGRFWIAISIIFVLSSFSIQVASSKDNRAPLSPEYPYEVTPNPGIPTLQEITAGATTDDEALHMVVDYYISHEDWLR